MENETPETPETVDNVFPIHKPTRKAIKSMAVKAGGLVLGTVALALVVKRINGDTEITTDET